MIGTMLCSLPVALLVEGGIFLTLAVGIQYGRRRRRTEGQSDTTTQEKAAA